ncbi:hypothetical protein EJ04DRAFT_521995 [Polyplosphaeria fusca]|uniref:DUF7580 domain-containing protein n=1 Tax=Polyplosphaeria fusca TaxID=682080 RepID=A0A9P4R3M1_9PLEO|nr:hypothetical protein EJ04DRAFT_521995 [Polyplosphaeria fusca]
MSGVEVAGLALAVLPVLIPAIKLLKKKNIEPRQNELVESVAFEIWFLHRLLIKLAKRLVNLSDEEKERLASPEPSATLADKWKAEEVVQALKTHLGDGYDTFCTTLASTMGCLEQLVKYKSLSWSRDEANNPQNAYAKLAAIRESTTSTPVNNLKHRVHFAAVEARRYEINVSRITENNKKLERLIGLSEEAVASVQEPVKDEYGTATSRLQLRPLMHTLHSAVNRSWTCDCQHKHQARLGLHQQHDGRRDSVTDETGESDHIYVEMLISCVNGSELTPKWLDTRLCVALNSSTKPNAKEPSPRGVRFQPNCIPKTPLVEDASSPSDTLVGRDKSGSRRSSLVSRKKVDSICQTASLADRHSCAPQIMFDGDSLWHMTSKASSRRSSRTCGGKRQNEDLPLSFLLGGKRKFKMKEKRILPVILANSLLNLSEGPWVENEWAKEHIHFFTSADSQDLLDIQRPFLSTDFQHQEDSDTEEEDALYRVHPSPSVLALGILLLEIELGFALESYYSECDLDDGIPNVNTNYLTALRMFEEEVSDSIYSNYRGALSACLNCDFFDEDTMAPNLDNEEFRRAVYNNIVKPLEDELRFAYPDETFFHGF